MRRLRVLPALFAMVAILVLGAARAHTALAQGVEPLSPAALDAARARISNDDVNVIARELWCPLCNNVRLDTCELKACDQMKDVIRIKLAQGEGLQTIQEYFLVQYGPQVLGAPPTSGFNLMAWVLPVVVLLGGALYLALRLRGDKAAKPAATPANAPAATVDAEYARKLEEELRNYD